MSLAFGLIEALPRLVEKIPVIIEKLLNAIYGNIPKLLEAGITLIIELAKGLIKAIPQLVSKIPQIISSMVSTFSSYLSKMGEIGKNLVSGIWNGISNSMQWIKDKIKGWVGNVTSFLKRLFGINSPSTLFRDEIGTNLALGVGEGFGDTMSDVSEEMANAIPTEFDADVHTNINTASSPMSNYDMTVMAFKQALSEVKVYMNSREMGSFVTDTVERAVFA
jgi:phage-related protein